MPTELYQMLLNNDDVAYKLIYQTHYKAIKQYVLKNSGSEDDVKDLFQEGIIALWDNINSKKYAHTNDNMLHGYFRTICKYKWTEMLRNKSKAIFVDAGDELDLQSDVMLLNDLIKKEEIKEFSSVFSGLSDKCRQILSLFYYDKKSMKDISLATGYEISSMRNEKYKCIEKLKDLYFKNQVKKR